LIATRFDVGKRYPKLLDRLLEPDERRASAPLSVGVLEVASRIPLLGRRLAPAQPLAVASLILTLTQREVMSRIKILVPRIVLIAFFAISLGTANQYFSPMVVAFYGFMGLLTGCDLITQSSQPEASWLLLAAPVDARQIISGLRLAVGLKYFSLPAVLVTIAVFFVNPPILAALLVLCYLVETRCIISLLILMRPAIPLSREHAANSQFVGLVASLVVAVVTGAGYVSVVSLYSLFGNVGLVVGAVGLMALIFASYWLDRGAASRLRKLQYEH